MEIIAINNKTNKKFFINIDSQWILEDYYNCKNDHTFVCGCNSVTKMILGKKNNFYVQSAPGEKETHSMVCPFAGNAFESIKGYKRDMLTGKIHFDVGTEKEKDEEKISLKDDPELDNILLSNNISEVNKYFKKRNIKKNKLTFKAFVTKMLTDAWNNYYFSYTKGRTNRDLSIDAFLRYFYGKSNDYLYNDTIVNSALDYHNKDVKTKFEIGLFIKREDSVYPNKYTITLLNRRKYNIEILKEMYDKEKKSITSKTKKYLVFIKRIIDKKYKPIKEIAIIPINSYGLPSGSSYEAKFYDELIEKGINFKKPYEIYDNTLYEYVPDAVIRDGIDNEIIVEIFGMEGNEKYDKLKKEKIKKAPKNNRCEFKYKEVTKEKDVLDFAKEF